MLRAALPWLMLLALIAAACAPLLLTRDALFIGGLHGDMIATIWFYDLVGRSLPEIPAALSTFDWPAPYDVTQEFPTTVEAVLGGTWLRWQGWVDGWGEVQSTILAVNALGAALLAYAAGCRGAGVFLAGGLSLLCRQLWFDLVGARLNAAWPGLAMGALGCVLLLLEPTLRRPARVGLVLLGGLLGALAAQIYPPHLVGFTPLGLLLVAGPARRQPGLLLWALAPVALALLGSAEALQVIAETREGRDCTRLACPDALHVLSAEQLVRWRPAASGLSAPGEGVTAWLALPLVALHSRRWTLLAATAALAPLLLIALGPCPSVGGVAPAGLRTLESWSGLWCGLHQLSDYGRAATVAALCAAVLSGLGVEVLPRSWARWGAAVGLVGLTGWMFFHEYRDRGKWQRPYDSPSALFLADAAPGPVAELPYDTAGQFLSALEAPDRPRLNPLKLQPRLALAGPAAKWLHALGQGQPAGAPAPTAAALGAETGVRWVLLEPGRCGHHGTTCARDTIPRVSAVLGDPAVHFGGALYVWPVSAP